MKTSPFKKRSLLLGLLIALPLLCIAGIVFFFVGMYQRDMQALTDFMASYQAYDQAITAANVPIFAANENNPSAGSEEELRAEEALSILKTKSAVRISSLIKNENKVMRAMQEIASLADNEMTTLKAYRKAAAQGVNRDGLEQTIHDLTNARQAAFAHFQELGR